MDASTSQDIIDLTVPAKSPKISSVCNNPTVSEQLHLLTTLVNQLRINSEQALEQTKPLIQTFPLANVRQLQYLYLVQQEVAQFFVDLNTEKGERLKLGTTIRQFEEELTQLGRQVNEPSSFSLLVPFTIDPPNSAAFQDSNVLGNIRISKPRVTITLKKTSSITSRSQLTEPPRAPHQPKQHLDILRIYKPGSNNWKKKLPRQGIVAKQLHPFIDLNLPSSMIKVEPCSQKAQTLHCKN